jgi:hypothetical protein
MTDDRIRLLLVVMLATLPAPPGKSRTVTPYDVEDKEAVLRDAALY